MLSLKVTAGRSPSKSQSDAALLSTLSGHKEREARKKIEALLLQEAQEADVCITLQRRVTGRKDPLKYLALLQKDDHALGRWYQSAFDRHGQFEAAVVIQRRWIYGSDEVKAALVLAAKLAKRRANLRYELLDVLELRDDVRTQAFEFYEQAAVPIYRRVKEIKTRLSDLQAKALKDAAAGKPGARITSTKHPGFTIVQTCQRELLGCKEKLKAIEQKMVSFGTKEEMKMLKKADGDAGVIMRELLALKKHAVTPSRGVGRKGWGSMTSRWKTEQRRAVLKASALGPERKATTTALEEARALREEMELVSAASSALVKTKAALASIRANSLSAYEEAEAAAVIAATRKATNAATPKRSMLSVLGTPRHLPEAASGRRLPPAMQYAQGGAAPACSIRPKSVSSSRSALHGRSAEQETPPLAAQESQTPLWLCSPSGPHEQDESRCIKHSRPLSRPHTRSSGLSLSPLRTADMNASGMPTVEVGISFARTKPQWLTKPLASAYKGTGARWTPPLRFDLPSSSWVACKRPIELPVAPSENVLRKVRSLPSLVWDAYS